MRSLASGGVGLRREALFSVSFQSKQGVQPGGAVKDGLSAFVASAKVDSVVHKGEEGNANLPFAAGVIAELVGGDPVDFCPDDVVDGEPDKWALRCSLFYATLGFETFFEAGGVIRDAIWGNDVDLVFVVDGREEVYHRDRDSQPPERNVFDRPLWGVKCFAEIFPVQVQGFPFSECLVDAHA